MGFRVASASDYAKLLKTANKNLEGVSQWEQYFLQPVQQAFQTAGEQVSAQTSYDISSAYANYKKQQLNLLQNQALATGFKEQAGSQLKTQYQTAFSEAKAEEASNLQTLAQQYQKTLETEEANLLKRGEQLSNIEKAIWDFRNIDISKLEELGYYETVNGGYQLTELGKDLIDEALNQGRVVKNDKDEDVREHFSDYLYETNPELYEFYTQNLEDVREVVGGLSRSDVAYSPEERQYSIKQKQYQEQIKNVPQTFVKTEFSSEKEKTEYLENFANKLSEEPSYRGHVSDISAVVTEGALKEFKSKGTITINGKQYSANKLKTIRKVPNGINSGDIFEEDGDFYVYVYMGEHSAINNPSAAIYKIIPEN